MRMSRFACTIAISLLIAISAEATDRFIVRFASPFETVEKAPRQSFG
jgi:hypothetical protein